MGDLGLRNKVQTSPSILQERLSKKADVAGRNVWEQKEGVAKQGCSRCQRMPSAAPPLSHNTCASRVESPHGVLVPRKTLRTSVLTPPAQSQPVCGFPSRPRWRLRKEETEGAVAFSGCCSGEDTVPDRTWVVTCMDGQQNGSVGKDHCRRG